MTNDAWFGRTSRTVAASGHVPVPGGRASSGGRARSEHRRVRVHRAVGTHRAVTRPSSSARCSRSPCPCAPARPCIPASATGSPTWRSACRARRWPCAPWRRARVMLGDVSARGCRAHDRARAGSGGIFDVAAKEQRLAQLDTGDGAAPSFWEDNRRAQEVIRERTELCGSSRGVKELAGKAEDLAGDARAGRGGHRRQPRRRDRRQHRRPARRTSTSSS